MGLDTSHNCWHGPYSTFNDFREWLGKLVGIDLYAIESLDEISDNDLYPLFNHSDCDGELSVDESRLIIRGIDSALSRFNQIQTKTFSDFYFHEKAIQFRNGLLDAVNNNEIVIFR